MGNILTTGTEPGILETLRFVALIRGPHEVVVTESSLEMLQRARRDKPSLAIWDLGFHDRVKSQHLGQWYADSTLQTVPLVLLTPASLTRTHVLPLPLPRRTTCLTKPVDLVELGLRVGALLDSSNKSLSLPAGYRRQVGDLVLDYHLFQATIGDKSVSLTPTEFKLLRYLMESPGQTFSSEQLLDEVWKYPPGIGSPDVVRMYVKRLRDKIEPDPHNPRYVVTIPGHGYQMPQMLKTSSQPTNGLPLAQPDEDAADWHHETHESGVPSMTIDSTLQEIFLALQTVTLTCQATLTTMARLVDELSQNDGSRRHIGPTALRKSLNGTHAIAPPISHREDGFNSSADEIAVATQSLSGLAAELQATLTQLQDSCPTSIPNLFDRETWHEMRVTQWGNRHNAGD